MEKLTLTNVKKLLNKTDSDIKTHVLNWVIDKWQDCDDKTAIFTDVLNNGCQSGSVSELIYYSDTIAFYEEYKNEINELLYNVFDDCGIYNPKDLFGSKWDEEDPLALDDFNKNLLAWFGFEETLRNIARDFDELSDLV